MNLNIKKIFWREPSQMKYIYLGHWNRSFRVSRANQFQCPGFIWSQLINFGRILIKIWLGFRKRISWNIKQTTESKPTGADIFQTIGRSCLFFCSFNVCDHWCECWVFWGFFLSVAGFSTRVKRKWDPCRSFGGPCISCANDQNRNRRSSKLLFSCEGVLCLLRHVLNIFKFIS